MIEQKFWRAGLSGGVIFETFIALTGLKKSRGEFTLLKRTCRSAGRMATSSEWGTMEVVSRILFYFNVLATTKNNGNAANRQVFYQTLMLNAQGLARTGIDFARHMRLSLAQTSYDRELKLHTQKAKLDLRSLTACMSYVGE